MSLFSPYYWERFPFFSVEKSKTRPSLLPETIGNDLVVKYSRVVLLNVSNTIKSHVDLDLREGRWKLD